MSVPGLEPMEGVVLVEEVTEVERRIGEIYIPDSVNADKALKVGRVYALPKNYEGTLEVGMKAIYPAYSADPIEWTPTVHAVYEADFKAVIHE